VITGTYHGAIFALAQGIPVIGLANSDEYFYKLSGLTDEFGQGCQVIHLDDREFAQLLSHKIDQLWGLADKLRPELLTAAARQIKWGYIAYQRINDIVTNRKSI
jgi:colanic acid/amylovoran biosynthesis protein